MHFISVQSTLISIVIFSKGAVLVGPICIFLVVLYFGEVFISVIAILLYFHALNRCPPSVLELLGGRLYGV